MKGTATISEMAARNMMTTDAQPLSSPTFLSAKLLLLFVLISVLSMGLLTSCQSELEDRYLNPDRTNDPAIDKLFTAMLDNNRVRPSYWEISTFVNWHIGIYTQSVGYLNYTSVYQQNERYIQDRWDDFYKPGANGAGVIAQFREMESAYELLTNDERNSVEIFMNAAKVVLYDQATQMVDLWGDIPFRHAGMLNKSGTIEYPAFDAAQDIYSEAIDELKKLSIYFSDPRLSSAARTSFRKQDILLHGDLDLWRRYCNSLRLRLLMRISFAAEGMAREQVHELLGDPVRFPLLNDAAYDPAAHDILLRPLTTYTDDLRAAFADWINYPAPYFMLEQVLKPANDPRIPVLFDKYGSIVNNQFVANTEFQALPLSLNAIEQQSYLGKYAIVDSATFLQNSKLPGVVMTAPEVNFLKAEAFERWGGGSAEDEYKKGIKNSIRFYYYLNSSSSASTSEVTPTDQEIDAFLNNSAFIQYEGDQESRLQKIWTQKWVHFGFLQSVQGWAELRRTDSPVLYFHPAHLSGYELPPSRLTYPASERTFNFNYAKVSAQDLRTSRIFWDIQ